MCNHTQSDTSMLPVARVCIATLIIILSCVANIFFLFVLSRVKSTREIKNDCYGFYLIHISTTNIIASLICIVTAVAYSKQNPGDLSSFMRYVSTLRILASSLFIETVALMTLERYHVTQNPLRKRKTLSRVKRKIFVIWLWAVANGAPQFLFYKDVSIEHYFHSCVFNAISKTNKPLVKLYAGFRFLSIFVIPTCIIVFCCGGILLAYSTESALALKRRERYRKFVAFVGALLCSFAVTNLPKQILELVMNLNVSDQLGEGKKILFVVFLFLSWTNYLITPLIYFTMYIKDLRTELCAASTSNLTPTVNCGLTQLYHQMFNSPMLSSRRSSGVDLDSDLVRRHLLETEEMDGRLLEHINTELFENKDPSGGGSTPHQNSAIVDGLASMFKKRGGEKITAVDETDVFRVLMPNVEYVVNRLNQNTTNS